jgi:siroheme synthase-like protein
MTGQNNLFPVFLKLEKLSLLIIGGGNVALEKLTAVLKNSPQTKIKLVAREINPDIQGLTHLHVNLTLIQKAFEPTDIDGTDLVFIAINDHSASQSIRDVVHQKGKLANVADKPDLCDFYLGSIVQKGSLKIGISTNGQSPTAAKRIKEVLNESLPDELDELIQNLQLVRNQLQGDFKQKVIQLNEITKSLVKPS